MSDLVVIEFPSEAKAEDITLHHRSTYRIMPVVVSVDEKAHSGGNCSEILIRRPP